MNERQLKEKHLSTLKENYLINSSKYSQSEDFLYFILRKANLGLEITDIEFLWLEENNFYETINMIQLQQYITNESNRLITECCQIRRKYKIPENVELPISSSVDSVLWQIDTNHRITETQLDILNQYGFLDTVAIIHGIQQFSELKCKYQALQYPGYLPDDPLYPILIKLNKREEIQNLEAEFLIDSNLEKILEIYWQQEEEKQAELLFLELKNKYQVTSDSENSTSSQLFSILKKIDQEEELTKSEYNWLEQHHFIQLVALEQKRQETKLFAQLKVEYHATEYQDKDPSSPLYKILFKLALSKLSFSTNARDLKQSLEREEWQIVENDITWLMEQNLSQTVEAALSIHFKYLKTKYQLIDPNLPRDPFYEIMLKLEREERLDPKQVVQLIEDKHLARHGKIAIAYYRLEAIFYEKEYKRTGNKWHLPSASSNWRKANEPEKALQVTNQVNWAKVSELDLKSALFVTRGAAFRDLKHLDHAEDCATKAIECQPESHQPYTLMGAICYDRGEYLEGDEWFEMAAERGADDADDEVERIVRMTKDQDKRREVAEYLIRKDSQRYAWAKSYLK